MRFALLLALVCCVPHVAFAHAMPVSYLPQSADVVEQIPEQIEITFSERVDARASSVHVKGPDGVERTTGAPARAGEEGKTLTVPVSLGGEGTYTVSWSVVSEDDGHFTKGAYAFGVGVGTVVAQTSATSEVVKIATVPEALAMTVSLAGNGIIWAVLVIFAVALRRMVRVPHLESHRKRVEALCMGLFALGGVLAVGGGVLEYVVKALDLAGLQNVTLGVALGAYLHTAAGSAVLGRVAIALLVLVLGITQWKRMCAATRVTLVEGGMLLLMLFYAYLRAKISHATANPFHPEVSVIVNIVHLVEKDIWFGFVLVLLVFALIPRLRAYTEALVRPVFLLLAGNLALVSITASYIIWLHLKSFDNLFTTEWGTACVKLVLAAVLLVLMRSYHVVVRLIRPAWFARFLPATLAAEVACALLVIFASSAIIITSPPLAVAHGTRFVAHSEGATITLERSGIEDTALLLTVAGVPGSPVPFVSVRDTSPQGDTLSVPLRIRYPGGYAFPAVLMSGTGPYEVKVTAPQVGGYDAHATFMVSPKDIELARDPGKERAFDAFTFWMMLCASAALLYAGVLYYLSREDAFMSGAVLRSMPPYMIAVPTFLLVAGVIVSLWSGLQHTGVLNPFKSLCESDGNMWHVMVPSRAGVPVSQVPVEGCMWGMGDYPYLFADMREYTYVRSRGQAEVHLTHDRALVPGVPITFTVSLTDADGDPALLFVDMEKLLHMVIISKDQTVFAHIHPDDLRPITDEDIRTSTYTLRYTFPKAGTYLIALDYAHGVTLGSKTIEVTVGNAADGEARAYPSRASFGGYDVALSYGIPVAGQVTTLVYEFSKDGKPVTTLTPYLSAAMHIAAVKNDFSSFTHTHGEIHPPGVPYPPVVVRNGKIVHSMASMVTPPTFGPRVEAHLIFPTPGRYTVWGQFMIDGRVVPSAFTVDVE